MFYFRSLLIPAFTISAFAATAQDVHEALNLGNTTVQGTARSMGFGNALGSVGGDYSTTSVNPAGLGIYRTSELTLTPSLRMNNASSSYLGATTLDNNVHFNFNNFAIVLTSAPKGKRYERSNWKVISFAFGMNRVADFNRDYTYQGNNYNSSATQAFEADANLYPNDPVGQPSTYPGYLGFQTYLVDTFNGRYYSTVPFEGGVNQMKNAKQTGHIDEYTISLGGNYKEQLMIGATLGLTSLKYKLRSSYSETLAPGNSASNPYGFSSFNYNQSLDISGGGVNLKLGAIYKITDNVRIGAAFHSPTVYSVTDNYTPYVNANLGGQNYTVSADNFSTVTNQFSYSYTSPYKAILSGTYIMKGVGFLTADYEYAGYNAMRFVYPIDDGYGNNYQAQETALNQQIKNTYKGTSNFRIGAEGLLTKFFMARAGFGYYGNPYRDNINDGQRIDISGGLGLRTQYFFVDVALVHSIYQTQFQPYTIDYTYVYSSLPAAAPVATTKFSSNNLAFTIGCKF